MALKINCLPGIRARCGTLFRTGVGKSVGVTMWDADRHCHRINANFLRAYPGNAGDARYAETETRVHVSKVIL